MASRARSVAGLLAIVGCAFGLAAVAQNAPGDNKPSASTRAADSYDPDKSVERDPLRACMMKHPEDANRLQNCGWDGTYDPKH
jgi:hypothetical protein